MSDDIGLHLADAVPDLEFIPELKCTPHLLFLDNTAGMFHNGQDLKNQE
jgi:hypothetical protein